MKQPPLVWELYQNAKLWGQRPSTIMAVEDEYVAWCLDQAVFHFGASLTAELEGVEGKNKGEIERKQRRILDRVLGPKKGDKGKFADPAMRLKKGG